MKEEERDIYQARKASEPREREPADVDRPYADLRARTWRSSLGFVALMLVVLGVAIWIIVREEPEPAAPEGEAGETDGFAADMMMIPEFTNFPDLEALPPEESAAVKDPRKAAQAMGQMRLGNQYLQAREWDAAERHAFKALEIWPDMNEALRMLGYIYLQRGQFDQAVVALERALKTGPFNAETLNALAVVHMHNRQMNKAEELLLSSVEIQPDYIAGHYNLGLLYIATGQYEASLDYLHTAAEGISNDPTIRNKLAVALLRLGRYDEARQNLDMVIAAMPEWPAAYFNMAITYTLEQKHTEALDWIRRGAQFCSPVTLQRFLTDTDFDGLRGHPEFQTIVREAYPEFPTRPDK